MKLYLIRHGQSTANLGKLYMGQTDVPLTEEGRQQAMSIRPILENIPFDKVFTSDLQRAVDTQKLALPNAKAPVRTKLLREVDVGKLMGTPLGELKAPDDPQYPKHRDYSPFDGECFSMVRDRATAFLDSLLADPCENVAVFSHFGFLCCMTQLMMETEMANGRTPIPNCGILVFEHDGTYWKLRAWNYGIKEV